MTHRIEVTYKDSVRDARGKAIAERIRTELGIDPGMIRIVNVYTMDFPLEEAELEKLATCLTDGVIEECTIDKPITTGATLIEKGFLPGVTDNVATTTRKVISYAIKPLKEEERVYSSIQYVLSNKLDKEEREEISQRVLGNTLIERFSYDTTLPIPRVTGTEEIVVEEFSLNLPEEQLQTLNRERCLAMSLEELKKINEHITQQDMLEKRQEHGLGKMTDCELEVFAQTWSEHCKHKEFNALITYEDKTTGNVEEIDGLFKTYIKSSTETIKERLQKRGTDWLVKVFNDNAGCVAFNKDQLFVWKVETHNSPSALDPYGGAITGIVGVNRDPAGTGKAGCTLLFNTDVFCFGNPFFKGKLPPNTLHPVQIYQGVYKGVEHGGNKSGIPTINGSIVFDNRYLGKPLVYCGTGGMMPRVLKEQDATVKEIEKGDIGIMAGGRVGKDGIHGATMSSEERHKGTPVTAVQIGDPITQKIMLDFINEARSLGLIKAITDNGAGGLSSSFGEIAQLSGGVKIFLDRVPLKYTGLQPWEILISESQERMTIVVSPENKEQFLALAKERDVEATVVATFTDDGFFSATYKDKHVMLLDMEFLHEGVPRKKMHAIWQPEKQKEPDIPRPGVMLTQLKNLLSRLNICSKEHIIRQYDHEVKGKTIVKPLTGKGPSDAGVIIPSLHSYEGLIVGHGICPRYSDIDAYHMAACAFDEMVRNIIATGGRLPRMDVQEYDMWSVNDNFCTPDSAYSKYNPDGKLKLAKLVRANKALYDMALAYNTPMTSGKDSMKNDFSYEEDGKTKRISVPLTLLFSGVAKIEDVRKCVTMDAKKPGDLVYVLGMTKDELGSSEYYWMHSKRVGEKLLGNNVPKVDAKNAKILYDKLAEAMSLELVASAHDCSDGGLGVALAETAFAGSLGMDIDMKAIPTENLDREDMVLFSESQSRFVVTVRPEDEDEFEKIMEGTVFAKIGNVTEKTFTLTLFNGQQETITIDELRTAWETPLQFGGTL